ncbi:MAG: hypothetical protein AVDCRST_MAG49-2331 [uncultured Thermomicrobiales bacterium]|uniref:Uncharacterized protein n=1 Tax=uncultured Thermomicrobiales bacterium TaxID=1645740 RepID=A0A6J4UTL4_9BACT|nr:MAG: hypothetical protein AVDCRST_MAG49-2331 [uncultured Thermomicrobiales bacterium]
MERCCLEVPALDRPRRCGRAPVAWTRGEGDVPSPAGMAGSGQLRASRP